MYDLTTVYDDTEPIHTYKKRQLEPSWIDHIQYTNMNILADKVASSATALAGSIVIDARNFVSAAAPG